MGLNQAAEQAPQSEPLMVLNGSLPPVSVPELSKDKDVLTEFHALRHAPPRIWLLP